MESNLKCLRSHTLNGQLPDFRQPTAITYMGCHKTNHFFEQLIKLEEYIYSEPQLLQEGLFYVNTFFRWKLLVLHVKKSGFGKKYYIVSIRYVLKHELSHYNCFGF